MEESIYFYIYLQLLSGLKKPKNILVCLKLH